MALQGPEELGEQVEEPEDLDDQDASSISPAEEITLPPGPGGDDEPDEAFLLPWDRFSTWLHCICVVGFDLELGQAVEVSDRGSSAVGGCNPLTRRWKVSEWALLPLLPPGSIQTSF